MTAPRRYGVRSLRFKLVLASVVVEAIMLTGLVWNSTRIASDAFHEIFQNRIETLVPLMNVTLAGPLAQRDYATLDERLGRMVRDESLVYVEVHDELGKIAARRGAVPETTRLDSSFEVPDHIYDQRFDITLAGRAIGRARYGLNVRLLEVTETNLRNQGMLVAAAEIVLTVLLLATLGALLTRRLRTLAQAAGTLAGGGYAARVPAVGRDEVADTARAFNSMAQTLAHDIAERKNAEEALRKSEARLNEAQRNALIGNWHYLPDGTLTWSDQMYELFKLPRDVPPTYEAVVSAIHPEDRAGSYDRAFMRALESDALDFESEYRVVWPDGQVRTVHSLGKIRREPDGRVLEAVGTVQDVTERKQAEQALRESEERLRLALDAAHMGTFDWDVPNNRIVWSRWHEELWGFKSGEFGGTYEAFSQRVLPEDIPGIDAKIARCVAARAPFAHEFRVVWPDGSTHWIAARGEFTFGAVGQPLRMRGAVVEITARKQAEETLRESEQSLARLIDNFPGAVYRCKNTPSWPVIFISMGVVGLTEYAPEDFLHEPPVVEFGQLIHPDDRERVWSQIQGALKERRTYEISYRVTTRSGRLKWYWEHGLGVFSESDELRFLEGYVSDITEHKRAEEKLRQWETLFRHAGWGVVLADPNDNRLVAVNPAFAAMHGYTVDEMLGMPLADTLAPEERARIVGQKGHHTCEAAHLRKDGSRFPSLTDVAVIRDTAGNALYRAANVQDITAIKKAREEQLRLISIIESTLDLICMTDLEGRLLYLNPSGRRLLGLEAHEALTGHRLTEFYPERLREYLANQAFPTALDKGSWAGESTLLTRAAQEIPVSQVILTHRDANGQPQYLSTIMCDMSERKRAEAALRETSRQLQTLSQRVLAAQEDERRRIARELHDELGQTLTAIKINLHARGRLKDQSHAELDAENIQLVENTLQQVRRLALALRPSMLDDLGLASALHWMADQQAERGDFAVQFDAGLPEARLAPEIETACFRIAQEALTNIARHARATRVAIELRREGEMLIMAVRDDGRGFDVAEMRARAATGGSIGVLGMQERAVLAGGQLTLESMPGGGTTVRVRLPWRTAGEAA